MVVAPPAVIDVKLTPASSIAGTVVDGAGHPVADARVVARWHSDVYGPVDDRRDGYSDGGGHFQIGGLGPEHYTLEARAAHAFATTGVTVGLADHVDGIALRLAPAFVVAGRVVIAETRSDCPDAAIALENKHTHRVVTGEPANDGRVGVDSVLPGTYEVIATCPGHAGRLTYPPVTITDRDVGDQVWEVDPAATLRGRVATTSGVPMTTGSVIANRISESRRGSGSFVARIEPNGRYAFQDLVAGPYDVAATHDSGTSPTGEFIRIDVPAGANIEHDFTLADFGTVVGVVTDPDGAPLAGVAVGMAYPATFSDAAGRFRFDAVPIASIAVASCPREMTAAATQDLMSPIANQTITFDIRCSRAGTIRGSVVDGGGRGVPDAYVEASGFSDNAQDHRVLTASDGTFTLAGLVGSVYSLHAYRRGVGEASAANVARGSATTLQLRGTATLAGVVRSHGIPVAHFDVELGDRREPFVATAGVFALHDLPGGKNMITFRADERYTSVAVDLVEGETRTIDVEIGNTVTLTGRVVRLGTTTPVSGVAIQTEGGLITTGENGRFVIDDVPAGFVRYYARGPKATWFDFAREVSGSGTVDLGDIPLASQRSWSGDIGAVLRPDVPFVDRPLEAPIEVISIDPEGPAAHSGLRVGDIITSVDGYDIRGERSYLATLLHGEAGAPVTIGLARGAFVSITRARRR